MSYVIVHAMPLEGGPANMENLSYGDRGDQLTTRSSGVLPLGRRVPKPWGRPNAELLPLGPLSAM